MAATGSSPPSPTHDWGADVDVAHLDEARRRAVELTGGTLRHLVLEVLAYAAEEAEALGRPGRCEILVHDDGSVAVTDDGRGTEVRRGPDGAVVRKPVMATRDLRFFASDDAPPLADGRPRRGMSVVAAVSTWLVHTNRRAEGSWAQRYERGVPVTDLEPVPADGRHGTTVHLLADPALVPDRRLTADDVPGGPWLEVALRRA